MVLPVVHATSRAAMVLLLAMAPAARQDGLAAARAFKASGATVIGTGRDQARLMALGQEVDLALSLDVTDPSSVEIAVAAALDRHGKIDVLVNNAGVGLFKPWDETNIEDLSTILDVNLLGVARVTQAVLPSMVTAGRGVIVNVASVAGRRAYPRHTAYCASKHALIGWSRRRCSPWACSWACRASPRR